MTCRAPLEAARRKDTEGRPIIYKRGRRPATMAEAYEKLELPCGQCAGCRLEKARTWATRMMHEAAWHEEFKGRYSTFITLTYDEENIPMYGTLVKNHYQDFMKRFRRKIEPHKISHYGVGEYGATCPDHELENCPICGPIQRPHYHAIIFGWSFPDKQILGTRDGQFVYESETLKKAWKLGSHEIGNATFESCSYVARYIMKKQTGTQAEDHYQKHIIELDELVDIEPEFALMSRNPAIGKRWYEEYWPDVYPSDEVPIPGRYHYAKPPRYYDGMYQYADPDDFKKIKNQRREAMAKSLLEGPSLESRAKVQDARLALKTRKL